MASRGRSNFTAKVNKFRRPNNGNNDNDEFNNDMSNQLNNYAAARIDEEEEEAQATSKRFADIEEINARDEQFGFVHYASGPSRTGWILNMKSVKEKKGISLLTTSLFFYISFFLYLSPDVCKGC